MTNKKNIIGGLTALLLATYSTIAMPYITIDYYNDKKEYYTKHPEMCHLKNTAAKEARFDASEVGTFWNAGNYMLLLMGYYLITKRKYTTQNQENKNK
ncbi:hypothetical protein J4440_02125 [Candidatus Woesearchaeota archaeon]|nr:hypothetical protein [Candidatus Woesearchaeota archaeon]